jgi:hypothetical protein
MTKQNQLQTNHPKGEEIKEPIAIPVDTFGGRIHVEWDPDAKLTPMGQLSFFIDFLKTAELYDPWVEECPLKYSSPNAPKIRDVLGTLFLATLAGHNRYAHITSIRCDQVNPNLLGMTRVVSEDSARRAFQKVDAEECQKWLQKHLKRCWEPLLYEPWILDIDTTVKPLYGKQEGAIVGYNPNKPGRPSHVYHTYMIGNLRLILDVEVHPGNESASNYTRPQLFALIDSLPQQARPTFIRGDSGFGNEGTIVEAESRDLDYLFKLRQTKKVKTLIEELHPYATWQNAGQGWEGTEAELTLTGWTRQRRVIVLRREIKGQMTMEDSAENGQQFFAFLDPKSKIPMKNYEYAVLVTSLPDEVLTIAQHYRDRADSENAFDELKNQWSWGGFTTKDLLRCQVMAQHTALIYNWWSLYVRLLIPKRRAEAITSRPLLLYTVGRQTHHAGQTKLTLTSMHGKYEGYRKRIQWVNQFLSKLRKNAEQLGWDERWRIILSQVFVKFLRGRLLKPPQNALSNL